MKQFLLDLVHNIKVAWLLDRYKRNLPSGLYVATQVRKFVVFALLMAMVFVIAGATLLNAVIYGFAFSVATGFLVLTLGIGWVTKNNGRVEFDELKRVVRK